MTDEAPKRKRGRKAKIANDATTNSNSAPQSAPKKRGRKPKGGKIITNVIQQETLLIPQPNIILHLKCGMNDLENNLFLNSKNIETFQFDQNKDEFLNINKNSASDTECTVDTNDNKNLWKKLQELAVNLHTNNISDKRSACFWCSCDFDNPPIYIPKFELSDSYHCYGCFCSPECATAYLFNENIDCASKFERYGLLNHLYCKIYNYDKNIKPAPNPYYTLDKFYGNLSIQQYRRLLKNERLLLVVDKPLTRVLPELHEDNDDFILNNKTIPSATSYPLRRKQKQSKKGILAENFNLK